MQSASSRLLAVPPRGLGTTLSWLQVGARGVLVVF